MGAGFTGGFLDSDTGATSASQPSSLLVGSTAATKATVHIFYPTTQGGCVSLLVDEVTVFSEEVEAGTSCGDGGTRTRVGLIGSAPANTSTSHPVVHIAGSITATTSVTIKNTGSTFWSVCTWRSKRKHSTSRLVVKDTPVSAAVDESWLSDDPLSGEPAAREVSHTASSIQGQTLAVARKVP